MSAKKHVRLVIAVDGTCTIDALHFPDASCLKATQEIQQALGGAVVKDLPKLEARFREKVRGQDREAAR